MAISIQNSHNPTPLATYIGNDLEDDFVNVDKKDLQQLKEASLAAMGSAPQVKERVAALAPQLIFQAVSFMLLSYVQTFTMLAYLNSPLFTYGVSATASIATNNINQKMTDVSGAIGSVAGTVTQGFVQTAYHTNAVYKMSLEDRNLIGAYTFPQAFIATM